MYAIPVLRDNKIIIRHQGGWSAITVAAKPVVISVVFNPVISSLKCFDDKSNIHFKSFIRPDVSNYGRKNVILAYLPISVEIVSFFSMGDKNGSYLAVALGGLPGDFAGDFAFEALTGVDFLLAGL